MNSDDIAHIAFLVKHQTFFEIRIAQINNYVNSTMNSTVLHTVFNDKIDEFVKIDLDFKEKNLFGNYNNSLNIFQFKSKNNKPEVINYEQDQYGALAFDWIYNYLFGEDFAIYNQYDDTEQPNIYLEMLDHNYVTK